MVTVGESTMLRYHNGVLEGVINSPMVEDGRKKQELADALQYCHILMLKNGLSTSNTGLDISFRSQEIGERMFMFLLALINDYCTKKNNEASDSTQVGNLDSSHPSLSKTTIIENKVIQPGVKRGVNKATEIEEILICSSDDECNNNPPYLIESNQTQEKLQKGSEESKLDHNASTEPATCMKSNTKKGEENENDSDPNGYKKFKIDSWVYDQIKILKNSAAPIDSEAVKKLAVEASAIYSFPEFKPTKEWLEQFLTMYKITFVKDKEECNSSVSLSIGECSTSGVMFNEKGGKTKPYRSIIPSSKKPLNIYSGKFFMDPVSKLDFTPIQVDLSAQEENSKQSPKKSEKAKKASEKKPCKKSNKKRKNMKPAINRFFKELKISTWMLEQLTVLKKNSIPFDSQTVHELAVKGGNIFLPSKFNPSKRWVRRFWNVYKEEISRNENEVSNETKNEDDKNLIPQPMDIDESLDHDTPIMVEKDSLNTVDVNMETNPSPITAKQELSLNYIPPSMKKDEPKSNGISRLPSPEIIILSSDDE